MLHNFFRGSNDFCKIRIRHRYYKLFPLVFHLYSKLIVSIFILWSSIVLSVKKTDYSF